MVDIIHKIGIKAPLSKVREAVATVAGVASWWTRHATGDGTPGGQIQVSFRKPDGSEAGKMGFEVTTDKQVRWQFKNGPQEWLGTEATFDLAQDGDLTIVIFGHRNWREAGEFMAHCSMKWATFLLSLRQYVETGKGRPAPDDLKIDNWN